MTVQHCFICAGADDDPGFDECAVCGRKGVPLPYGAPYGSASNRSAEIAEPREESRLARGIRLARGEVMPEHVPGILQRIAIAKAGTPAQATQVSSDPTANADVPERLRELRRFLSGEAPLDGVWFGERHPTLRGPFWWRGFLNTLERAADALPHPDTSRHVDGAGWETIDSAPRDGTVILIWSPYGVAVASRHWAAEFTHWRPLPDPPAHWASIIAPEGQS